MKKPIVAGVAVTAIAAVVAFVLLRGSEDETGVVVSGTVEATEADVGFQAAGRVEAIAVREGERVAARQELARLDRTELDARRAVASAQVEAAKATLAELRSGPRTEEIAQARAASVAAAARVTDAHRDLERTRVLVEGGAASREALEKATTQVEVVEAQRSQAAEQQRALERGTRSERIAGGAANVAQAEAALKQVETMLDNAVVSAPFGGIVTIRHREPGEVVAAGLPVVTLMDPSDRWVRVYLNEADVARIAPGAKATITADGFPDRTFAGEVTYIASEAEFTPRTVQTPEERTKLVYAVKVRIAGDDALVLKPGLPVDVRMDPSVR
jgi:HlyD family secretion protein